MASRKKISIAAKRAALKPRKARRTAAPAARGRAKRSDYKELRDNSLRQLLTSDGIDELVISDLRSMRDTLEEDYRRRVDGSGMAIFEQDKLKDCQLLLRHIEAMRIVLAYYGVND
jgi:hypothetical protein